MNSAAQSRKRDRTALHAAVEARFGVLPNFFRLAPQVPQIGENLWAFARFAYLDNPLPSLFKERLFVYLSRFCEVRYCIVRHAGFLLGFGRPSGDEHCRTLDVPDLLRLVRLPLPRDAQLAESLNRLATGNLPLAAVPDADTPLEAAVFGVAAHVFLQTPSAPRCVDALRAALGDSRFEHLLVFLAFVRTAHYWTKVHPELRMEGALDELLATHERLAECLLDDPEAGACEVSQKLLSELEALRESKARHERFMDVHESTRATNIELTAHVVDLRAAKQELQDSRRAALNVMEDAVRAQQLAERLNAELRSEIAQREQAEASLQRRTAQFETLVNEAPLGILLLDAACRILQVNPAGRAMFGNPADLIGRLLDDVVHALWSREYADAIVAHARSTLGSGVRSLVDEHPANRPGRAHEAYHWQINRIALPDGHHGLVCYVSDVSAQLAASEAITRSEERFRTLVSVITDVPWTTDADGRFVQPQPAWAAYTGQTWEELRDFGWAAALHPEDRLQIRHTWEQACRNGTLYESKGRLWHAPTRQYRYFHARATPIRDPDGSVREWVGTCTDVEEQRRAEEELRASDRRKDEFLATLAHELRNPLAPIRHAAKVARAPNATEAQVRWSHEVIERQVEHMALLLDDLLDVARITRGKLTLRREPLDLAAVIDAALEGVRPLVNARRHTVNVALSGTLRLEGDPLRLTQVFTNLLTNAAKYTDPGGTISIEAREEPDALVARVTDTGIGIAPEVLPKLFEMFSQAQSALDRAEGGLGIGLALTRGLVQLHGGTISAASAGLGEGTSFVVRLERGEAAAGPGLAEPAADGLAERSVPRRVLVVDDNRDSAASLAMLLELDHHEVRAVHDGEAALEAAGEFAPDAMLVDIGMPRMNGFELAQRVRAAPWGRNVTLIAITGWGQREDRDRALQAGFDHHLTKPANPDHLRRLLNRA